MRTRTKVVTAIVDAPMLLLGASAGLFAAGGGTWMRTWEFYLVPNARRHAPDHALARSARQRVRRGRGERVFGTMNFVMEQKMLRGIKERVERRNALDDVN